MSYGYETQRSGEETLDHGQDPQPLSSFVSVLELKAASERFPVAPQTLEFNSLESVVRCKGEGAWGLQDGPGSLWY